MTTLRAQRTSGYETPRSDVLKHVPTTAGNVLELGCATGALGATIRARQPASVLGVELDPEYATEAARRLDRVVVADAESFAAGDTPPEAPFDCLIAADVFEHLVDPWTTLQQTVAWLTPGATVVVSLPNVLWWRSLLRIVRERRWPREPEGVFDATHLRWFSVLDATDMLEGVGGEVTDVEPRYWQAGWRLALHERLHRLERVAPFLAPQHIFVARKP